MERVQSSMVLLYATIIMRIILKNLDTLYVIQKSLAGKKIFAYFMLMRNVISVALKTRQQAVHENIKIADSNCCEELFSRMFEEIRI